MILWAIVIVIGIVFRHQFAYFAGGYIIYPLVRGYCSIKAGVEFRKRHEDLPANWQEQIRDENCDMRKEADMIYTEIFDEWCEKHCNK